MQPIGFVPPNGEMVCETPPVFSPGKTLDAPARSMAKTTGRVIAALILQEKFGFVSPESPDCIAGLAPGLRMPGTHSPRPTGCARRATEIPSVIGIILMGRAAGGIRGGWTRCDRIKHITIVLWCRG
jgi:hypothetical protein